MADQRNRGGKKDLGQGAPKHQPGKEGRPPAGEPGGPKPSAGKKRTERDKRDR